MTQHSLHKQLMQQTFFPRSPLDNANMQSLSANIMQINQESMTYSQVKSVHQQISRDCSLLRNRIRLLQSEMERSQKKIQETTKRTQQFRKLREANDEKLQKRLRDEKQKQQQEARSKELFMQKKKLNEERAAKREQYFMERNRYAISYKQAIREQMDNKVDTQRLTQMEANEKAMLIREERKQAIRNRNIFLSEKRQSVIDNRRGLFDHYS